MQRLKNTTNSPYQFTQADGSLVTVPAFGEAEGEFNSGLLDLLSLCGAIQVTEVEKPKEAEAPRRGRPPKAKEPQEAEEGSSTTKE